MILLQAENTTIIVKVPRVHLIFRSDTLQYFALWRGAGNSELPDVAYANRSYIAKKSQIVALFVDITTKVSLRLMILLKSQK